MVFSFLAVTAIDGNYTEWASWTECSTTCGPGMKSRYRSCTNPAPAFGGKDCSRLGDPDQVAPCELTKCPGILSLAVDLVQPTPSNFITGTVKMVCQLFGKLSSED